MMEDVIVKGAGKKGKGVFALRSFKKGEFILRYKRGEVAHKGGLAKLSRDDSVHLNEVDYDTWEIMRIPERFINHSCEPNSIAKGRSVFALRPIMGGREDYHRLQNQRF